MIPAKKKKRKRNNFIRIVKIRLFDQNEENYLKLLVELVDRNEEMPPHYYHYDQIEERTDLNDQNGEMNVMMMEFVDQILKMLSDEHNHFLRHFHYCYSIYLHYQMLLRMEGEDFD
jgi:hypothetical protein